jgi:tetratricopeptide (TPR) repeat protein
MGPWIVAVALSVAVTARADAPRFEPPAAIDAAQQRYERGKKLFEAKQYAAAASEFAAAYELDADAKFLLFNLGLARRMAGACKESIDAYRAFLDANPPRRSADNARVGIERCEKIVASLPPTPEPPAPEPSQTPPPANPAPAVEPPVEADKPAASPRELDLHVPWYRDRAGDALLAGGAVFTIASVTLYILAIRSAADASTPPSLQAYEDLKGRASRLQTSSWIAGGVGGALLVGSVIRFSTRPSQHQVAVVPQPGGASLVMEGRC